MNQKTKLISICAWGSVILLVFRCLISWKDIIEGVSAYDLFGYASEAISISILFTVLYEKFIWRINPFEKTPKLAKRYNGILKSDYDKSERRATLEISQTLTLIHITLITDESKSRSLSASIDEILGEMQLTYCYLNTPKSEYRERSELHYGTATLSVSNPKEIDGQYYTDRKTTGDMVFMAEE